MSVAQDGAKQARKVIQQYQRQLNAPALVPEQCYRRNSATYPVVCYVNQVTALFISKNYAVIPLFLSRAYEALNGVKHAPVSDAYRCLTFQYLSRVAHFVVDYGDLSEEENYLVELIPDALLTASPSDDEVWSRIDSKE